MMIGYFFHALIQGLCFYWLLENLQTSNFSEAIEGYGALGSSDLQIWW